MPGISLLPEQSISITQDHSYTPIPQLQKDVPNKIPSASQKGDQCPPNCDHNYAELSDVSTELYIHDSDSPDEIVTTGGKIIISSLDKVEISLEY